MAAVLLLGVGVVIGSAIGSSSDESTPDSKPPFAAAKQKCAAYSPHAKLGDGGRSLTISGEGKERDGLPYTAVSCILREVDTPDAVIAQMESTRALDGRQQAQWGHIQASWTYHPDNGLQVILTYSE